MKTAHNSKCQTQNDLKLKINFQWKNTIENKIDPKNVNVSENIFFLNSMELVYELSFTLYIP